MPAASQRSCSPDAEGKITTAPDGVQVDTVTHDGLNPKGHTAKVLGSLQPTVAEHGQRPPDGSRGFPSRDRWQQRYYADAREKEPTAEAISNLE